jgi:putative N6-adenine-specific DNA methylase
MKKKDILKLKDTFSATCPLGLEDLLLEEIKELGINKIQKMGSGFVFEAKPIKAIELIYTSRYASRVYKQLYKFDIKKEKDLYHSARNIKWKGIFDIDQSFNIQCNLGSNSQRKKSSFKNSMFMGLTLKDAICDRFRDDLKERPDVHKYDADVGLHLHIAPKENIYSQKEEAVISLDMVGRPLSKRGYRDSKFRAPMKENLAAALCANMKEDAKNGFWDVMCGTSTVAIEMAYLLSDMPPVYTRPFKS